MSGIDDIREVRLKKLELLREAGMESYPAKTKRDFSLFDVRAKFSELGDKSISLAGRIMAIRGQGAILFVVLNDGTETFQAVMKKDELEEKLFKLFVDAVDVGDFLEVTGTLFTTQKGEQSLLTKDWRMLTKSLLPMPEKWAGIQDDELRLRKRYLDLLLDNDAREIFYKKAKFWRATRDFMSNEGFLEVETPTLEVTTGGAEANPFKTHHDDFDIDVFLRISVGELWQKRLLAGGFPRTFEIGRIYRNEGSSPDHLQEFTSMEFYASYMDYREGILFTEKLIKKVVKEVFGTFIFSARGFTFDLSGDWEQIDYVETVQKMTGINVLEATESDMKKKLDDLGVEYEGQNRERLTDTLWKYCRKQIAGPVWLINHPKLVSPLSKTLKEDSRKTERVQLILAGSEATNGFSELNDPIDQRARFELQQKLIESGDGEAMMPEWEFVEMLEHGMPPAFGFAYGDRLFSFLVDKPIRETVLFPLVKPRKDN